MPNREDATAHRLAELEMLFTHLERTVETLNEVIIEQGRAIDQLSRQLLALRGQVRQSQSPASEAEAPGEDFGLGMGDSASQSSD